LHPAVGSGSSLEEIGIVTAYKLNLRPEPTNRCRPLKVLKKGAEVEIIGRCDGWLKIIHEDRTGYIKDREKYVRVLRRQKKQGDNGDRNVAFERCKEEAKNIGRKIEKARSEVRTFTRKESAVINGLNKIDQSLNNTRQRVLSLESEIAETNLKLNEIEHALQTLAETIKINENYSSKRLVAIYKLNWLGKTNVIASAESMCELFQRKTAIEQILAHDENILKDLIANKKRLIKLQNEQTVEKRNKLSLEADLNQQIRTMSSEKSKRSKTLEDIRNKKSLQMAYINSLKKAAIALDQKINLLSSRYPLKDSVKETALQPFASLKGLLEMPVKGTIISRFGAYENPQLNVKNFHNGIDIKADRGEPIRAVYVGRILYANWFKGYGNMVIIDHGNYYYTVYAHIEELFKEKGSYVEKGEVIATVGDAASRTGPKLYFEVRHHGKPIDPLKWINQG
jgi:septal ring factor EnvC (AmiA/AmiB activator)